MLRCRCVVEGLRSLPVFCNMPAAYKVEGEMVCAYHYDLLDEQRRKSASRFA